MTPHLVTQDICRGSTPNHELQRTRLSRLGCNPGISGAGSLSPIVRRRQIAARAQWRTMTEIPMRLDEAEHL